jgi:serine/threonine protein kinase/WD40 repeat protein
MADDKNRNLLFAVLAVQLKGVSPERAMEAAAAWLVNPATPLSGYLEELGILPAADIKLLGTLVDEIVKSFEGNAEEALKSLPGGTELSLTLVGRHAPGPHQDTRPMVDLPEGMHVLSAAALEELPGRYSQVSEYGRGGMGRVLLVHDELFGREIALKELLIPHDPDHEGPEPSPMGEASGMLGRFLQEARITGQLEHPAIVPVYEIGRRLNGTFYYTMKLMRGKTLARAIRDCKNLEERLRILPSILDLCQALAYAHSRRVIHRDIKPANAMIGEFGETVLLDWGLAKIQGTKDVYSDKLRETLRSLKLKEPEKTPRTQAGEAIGTPHYMPPEQARGEIDKLDERSDVYSMGAMLYETLTGKPPFDGETARSIINQVLNDEPRSIEALAPGTPPELIAICRKAMAKRPEARYQTMLELRDDLVRFQTGAFVQSYRYNPREAITLYYRQHRVRLNAAAAAIAVVIAVGIWSYISIWQARELEKKQREAAETAQGEAEMARGQAEVAKGEAEMSREKTEEQGYLTKIHLAQSYLQQGELEAANNTLWSTREDLRGWEWGYLLNEANPDLFTVTAPGKQLHFAKFSPTGDKFSAIPNRGPPLMWDAQSGTPLLQLEPDSLNYIFSNWSFDGTMLAAISEAGMIRVWSTDTGKAIYSFPSESFAYSATFDRAGTRLFVGHEDNKVRIVDLLTPDRIDYISNAAGPVTRLSLTPDDSHLLTVVGETLVQIWDLEGNKQVATLTGRNVTSDPTGRYFAYTNDKDIIVAELPSAQTVRVLSAHTTSPFSVRFDNTGEYLASASLDGNAYLWSVATSTPIQRLFDESKMEPILDAIFTQGGRYVVSLTTNNLVSLWDCQNGSRLYQKKGKGNYCSNVDLAPDGRRIAISTGDRFVQVWDVERPTGWDFFQNQPGLSASTNLGQRQTVRMAQSGKFLALGHSNSRVEVLQTNDGSRVLDVTSNSIVSPGNIALHPHHPVVAATLDDHSLMILELESGDLLQHYRDRSERLRAFAFSPTENNLAFNDSMKSIAILDWSTGTVIGHYVAHNSSVSALAFHPNGQIVASGTTDGEIHCWRSSTQETVSQFSGSGSEIRSLQYSADGESLLSSSLDGTAREWNIQTGLVKTEYALHTKTAINPSTTRAMFQNADMMIVTESIPLPSSVWYRNAIDPIIIAADNRSLFLPSDGNNIISVNNYFSIARITPAPWKYDALDTVGVVNWEENYRLLRLRASTDMIPQQPTQPPPIRQQWILNSRDTIKLLESLIDNAPESRVVPSSPSPTWIESLVNTNFGIVSVNDVGISNESWDDTISEIRNSALGNLPVSVSLKLQGQNFNAEVLLRSIPLVTITIENTISLQDALLFVECELANTIVEINRSHSIPTSREQARVSYNCEEHIEVLQGLKLESVDHSIAFDGESYTTYNALQVHLVELRKMLASNDVHTVSRTIERGAFTEVRLTLNISNPI